MTAIPVIATRRLRLDAFGEADIPALAAILAEPEVSKCITANGSTPERCHANAAHRIGWHNGAWDRHGYGVWALRARDGDAAPASGLARGALIGWCGFAAPDIGDDPELLYGLAPQYWGKGLAREAASAAINWLFGVTSAAGVSAVVFGRLNPASVRLLGKLGLRPRGVMTMADFLPDPALAKDVLEYEIWRLSGGKSDDSEALLFQAPHKGGQIASLFPAEIAAIEQAFADAALARQDLAAFGRADLDRRVRAAFRQGRAEPWLDWHHLDRTQWRIAA